MTRATLVARVRAFVLGHRSDAFDDLAWALHTWQRARHPALAAFAAVGPTSGPWTGVPAVPVDLFRDPGFGGPGPVTFRTSGTTSGVRGAHHLDDTALYDLASPRWARACVPGLPRRTVALLEDPARVPDSSLSHMVQELGGPVSWHVAGGRVVAESLRALVQAPTFVPATAFALAEWLEDEPGPLPPGSVVMITGGYKGRIRRIDAADLVRQAHHHLRPARVVLEYGMTELSSQLWGTPGTPFLPPPWLRVVAVDPEGDPLPAGEVGQLRFVDLCNVDGAVAIETMDVGSVGVDGAVALGGRLAGAPLRGCSLALEATP
jgi:hypothetical protein